tara:strand:+ start:12065 stop:12844 length:780 start_codon:yes stop_codon:yes gene_type:complete
MFRVYLCIDASIATGRGRAATTGEATCSVYARFTGTTFFATLSTVFSVGFCIDTGSSTRCFSRFTGGAALVWDAIAVIVARSCAVFIVFGGDLLFAFLSFIAVGLFVTGLDACTTESFGGKAQWVGEAELCVAFVALATLVIISFSVAVVVSAVTYFEGGEDLIATWTPAQSKVDLFARLDAFKTFADTDDFVASLVTSTFLGEGFADTFWAIFCAVKIINFSVTVVVLKITIFFSGGILVEALGPSTVFATKLGAFFA